MKRVRTSPAAERDIDDIWYFVATQSGSIETADQFVAAITEAFAVLAQAPGAGTLREEIEPGLRGFPVGKYIVYYRNAQRFVEILRILHGMRDQRSAFGRD